jgi:hypothetical protein
VGIRAREDVVLVGLITHAIHRVATLIYSGRLSDVVPIALEVPVKVGDVGGNELTIGIVPRSVANSIPRVHRQLATSRDEAEVGVPGSVLISSLETSEVGSVSRTDTRDEEAHRLLLVLSARSGWKQ